jgi:hypothetical protein
MKERILYLTLCLVYLVPIWAVEYLPTTDGPAHTYNAWIVREHGNAAENPLLGRYLEVDARPLPNWLGHAAMAGLMTAVPPRIAEKILVSGYVLLFLIGVRFLLASVAPSRVWLAFLAFPLVYNQLFQMGLYNFCLGLALLLFAIGIWWRGREAPDARRVMGMHALLLLIWFSHLVAHALALIALGALWLLTRRRHPLHLAVLVPQVALPIWFLASLQGEVTWIPWGMSTLGGYLLQMGSVFSLHQGLRIGMVLGLAFLVLLALTLRGRLGAGRMSWREEDAFLLLSVFCVVLFFLAPDRGLGGSLLKQRLALIPPLLLLPWLAPDLAPGWGRRSRAAVLGGLVVLSLAHAAFLLQWYRSADRDMRQLVAGTADIAPRTRVLPLLFERDTASWAGVLGHSFSYAAVDKELLDWSNYEAASGYFPVRFRSDVRRPDAWMIEARPGDLDPGAWRDEIDYVYCWKMRPGSGIARRIEEHYALVAVRGPARLYARKGWRPASPPPPADAVVARLED